MKEIYLLGVEPELSLHSLICDPTIDPNPTGDILGDDNEVSSFFIISFSSFTTAVDNPTLILLRDFWVVFVGALPDDELDIAEELLDLSAILSKILGHYTPNKLVLITTILFYTWLYNNYKYKYKTPYKIKFIILP